MEPITSAKYLREDIDDNNNESKTHHHHILKVTLCLSLNGIGWSNNTNAHIRSYNISYIR